MFFLYKYRILHFIRAREQLFWCLMFPIILGTFFELSFGNANQTENFQTIPIAVVETSTGEQSKNFRTMLNGLQDENNLLSIKYTSMEEARNWIDKDEISGIIEVGQTIRLITKSQDISQNILKSIIDQYLQVEHAIQTIAGQNPQQIETAILAAAENLDLNKETSFGDGTTDWIVQYFYVLIAMACLYGSYLGMDNIMTLQANLSAVGIRRSMSPTRKIKIIISDFLAAITLQYINVLLLLAYLVFVLNIDFGNQFALILFTALIGVIVGVAMGTVVGAVVKAGSRMKDAMLTVVTLFFSFLGGLMFGSMQDIIEHHVPIINRINPAALIKDAYYCLSVFDNYARYTRNIITLLLISVLFCGITVWIVRREKYASI